MKYKKFISGFVLKLSIKLNICNTSFNSYNSCFSNKYTIMHGTYHFIPTSCIKINQNEGRQ